jgi:hypothetical protein
MFYELWDVRSGNIVNTYGSEVDALTAVRALVAANGRDYGHALSLAVEGEDEDTRLVAKGPELVQRAERAVVPPPETRAAV